MPTPQASFSKKKSDLSLYPTVFSSMTATTSATSGSTSARCFSFSNSISASGCMPMCDAIMNSSRASPTPSHGVWPCVNTCSGTATFIMILVRVLGITLISVLSILNFNLPSYTRPSPSDVSTVTAWPSFNTPVPLPVPMMHGIPSSLETIAAWQVLPPLSVTIAEAILIIGSQSGSVLSVTSTSPFLKSDISNALSRTFTVPAPILLPTASPVMSTSLFSSRT